MYLEPLTVLLLPSYTLGFVPIHVPSRPIYNCPIAITYISPSGCVNVCVGGRICLVHPHSSVPGWVEYLGWLQRHWVMRRFCSFFLGQGCWSCLWPKLVESLSCMCPQQQQANSIFTTVGSTDWMDEWIHCILWGTTAISVCPKPLPPNHGWCCRLPCSIYLDVCDTFPFWKGTVFTFPRVLSKAQGKKWLF